MLTLNIYPLYVLNAVEAELLYVSLEVWRPGGVNVAGDDGGHVQRGVVKKTLAAVDLIWKIELTVSFITRPGNKTPSTK